MTRRHRDIEGPYHRAVIAQLHRKLPGAVIHHSPNEFPGTGPMIARAIAKAKKNGMQVGFPDLVVFWRGEVALIEVKAPGGRLRPSQEALGERLSANGFRMHVVTDPADAAAIADEMHEAASTFTTIGAEAAKLVEKVTRQRANAPGMTADEKGSSDE